MGHGFDFWVLALSWSPSYCASEGDRANRQQCASGASYGFIVHGLWPQFEAGYPEYCVTGGSLDLPNRLADSVADILPSRGLAKHQWKKHGTCSGLSQADYLAALRAAHDRVRIPPSLASLDRRVSVDPDDVETAFAAANPGLDRMEMATSCDRRFLREIRICLTRETLDFRACPEVDRRDCRLDTAVMPPRR